MSSNDILISIVRYVRSRYDLDFSDADESVVMRKTEYLARARKDARLYEYIADYRQRSGGLVVPILKKTISNVSKRA